MQQFLLIVNSVTNNLGGLTISIFIYIILILVNLNNQDEIIPPQITGSIKIDGCLIEEGWKDALILDQFYICSPKFEHGKAPEVRTQVLIGYDDFNLYFGFICFENDMSTIKKTRVGGGEKWKILQDDKVQIILNTFINYEESYTFWINPYGIQYTQYYKRETNSTVDINIIWYANAKINDSCWTVEVAIPFTSLRYPDEDVQKWKFILVRSRPRKYNYWYELPLIPPGVPSIYPYLNKLCINERIKVKKIMEFLPYFVVGINKEIEEKLNLTNRLGVSGKYYFTQNYILDWAFLPDYSQIESDAPQIDVNTKFALYYQEQRPFFLERKILFETPLDIFYSRTINDPIAALKFAGNIKDISLGYISAYDQHSPWIIPFAEMSSSISSDNNSITNILRIKKSILKNSYVGFLNTNRDLSSGFNRTFDIDGCFSFLKYHSIAYEGVLSWTKEPNDSSIFIGYPYLNFTKYTSRFDGEEFIGKGFFLNFNHNSKYLSVDAYYKGLSPEFRADNGFIQYNDFESRGFSSFLDIWPKKLYTENITPGIGLNETKHFLGKQITLEKNAFINIQLQNQIYLSFDYKILSREYSEIHFDGIWKFCHSLSASLVKYLNISVFFNYGREINYQSYLPTLGYILTPLFKFKFNIEKLGNEFTYSRYLFWQDDFNNRIYDIQIIEEKLTWAFSHYLNLRFIFQYSSAKKEIFFSPLLSLEPTPFTIFFVGSNHSFARQQNFNSYELAVTKIFLKFQYLIKL